MTPSPSKKPVTGWQRTAVIRLDKIIYKFSHNWIAVFNIIVAVYVTLPILAPVLMKAGASGPARAIYTIYRPMCHQMASRSYFLFGEQYAYPRELAETNLNSLESYTSELPEFDGVDPNNWVNFFISAQRFLGNEHLGYKMALCERDMFIYGFVLFAGLLYALLRRRYNIKPLPLWLFILIGMGPIGLDGFSQLFGYYSTPLNGSAPAGILATIQAITPLRESTPFLRSATGALFGFMLAWLAYPSIDGGMRQTAVELKRKLTRIGELPE